MKLDSKTVIEFCYDSHKKIVQEKVYLKTDDKIYKGQQFLDHLAAYGKTGLSLKKQKKWKKLLNNTFLTPMD